MDKLRDKYDLKLPQIASRNYTEFRRNERTLDLRTKPIYRKPRGQGLFTIRQLIGLFGSIILFTGVFTPILSVPIMGNLNYFQNGKGDGTIILILSVISLILVVGKKYKGLWFTGLGSIGVLLFTFINFQLRMSQIIAKAKSEGITHFMAWQI